MIPLDSEALLSALVSAPSNSEGEEVKGVVDDLPLDKTP